MKISLAILLPFALFKVHAHQYQGSQLKKDVVIEVPKNFCELDKRDSCTQGRCIRYDPKKFQNSPSVITYFPGGRLGNMISAFLVLLWIKLEFGHEVYYEKESHMVMSRYFENVDIVPSLEDSLCNWKEFPFRKYEGNIEYLGRPEWKKGKAIEIYMDKSNFMRHEIQGGRHFYKKYRKESLNALKFRKKFQDHADNLIRSFAEKAKKSNKKKHEITFVGIHNRRTDYLEFRRKRLGLEDLYEDYFEDAMEYFKDEYDFPIFIFISDDMEWGREKLNETNEIYFGGCGNPNDTDCIGKDLALLASCNHTITSHGSFGHWGSFLAGGDIYTEYGVIIPDAYS